jgi:hypothetical protein
LYGLYLAPEQEDRKRKGHSCSGGLSGAGGGYLLTEKPMRTGAK